MKTHLVTLAAILFVTAAHSSPPAPVADLTTLAGKTYKSARVFHVEPDGITYMFAGGMVKIPFTDLPDAVCKAYNYDSKNAMAFAEQDAISQQNLFAAKNAQEAIVRAEQSRIYEATAQHLDGIDRGTPMGTLNSLNTGHVETASSDGAGSGKVSIAGRIISVDTDAGIVLLSSHSRASIGAQNADGIVAITGLKVATLNDGDQIQVRGVESGSYEYTSVLGASMKVRMYDASSQTGAAVATPSRPLWKQVTGRVN